MVARAGLKGLPANIMADGMHLQPDRCLRCNLWGLHAHWVPALFIDAQSGLDQGIAFKDQFDTQGTFLRQFGAELGSEAA